MRESPCLPLLYLLEKQLQIYNTAFIQSSSTHPPFNPHPSSLEEELEKLGRRQFPLRFFPIFTILTTQRTSDVTTQEDTLIAGSQLKRLPMWQCWSWRQPYPHPHIIEKRTATTKSSSKCLQAKSPSVRSIKSCSNALGLTVSRQSPTRPSFCF